MDIHAYFCMQVKMFLEQTNHQLPNLSKNLFILFNHWDELVNDEDCDDVKSQHLQNVREFLVQGLQSKAVMDRTFFVSGQEACRVQENEKKGKQAPAGGLAGVYSIQMSTLLGFYSYYILLV